MPPRGGAGGGDDEAPAPPKGRRPTPRTPNVHDAPCQCCGTTTATVWRAAPPDDGVPLEPFLRWRWYCSGPASGGTAMCPYMAKKIGAAVQVGRLDPRTAHDVLGVLPTASDAEIRAAFRAAEPKYNPSKMGAPHATPRAAHRKQHLFDLLVGARDESR